MKLSDFGRRVQQAKKLVGIGTDKELADAIRPFLPEKMRGTLKSQHIQKLKQATHSVYTPYIAEVCGVRAMWLASGIEPVTDEARGLVAPQHMKLLTSYKALPADIQESLGNLIRHIDKRLSDAPRRPRRRA